MISSETLQIRPALLYSDMQSVVGFSGIPKCITLNGFSGEIFGRDSSFWQYMGCANTRADSLEKRRQNSGSRVNAHLELLFLDFENYCVKLNTDRPISLQLLYSLGNLVSVV